MADAAMDLFEKMAIERQKTINAILQFLNQMIRENNLSFKDQEVSDSLEELSKHVQKGGTVRSDIIDAEDVAMFESLLKKYRVTYSAVKVSDPKAEGERVVYLTRDTDQMKMNLVRKQYFYELGVGINEISLQEMAQYEEGREVGIVTDLSAEETELFRYYASDYSFGYSVIRNEDGFDIYFPHDAEKEIKAALRKAAYDLSFPDLREAVYTRIRSREDFEEQIRLEKKEVYVVADADNPNNFITVTDEGFATHHLQAQSATAENGDITVQYSSKDRDYSASERGKLMSCVEQLKTPVIIKDLREFTLIDGFGKDGGIILPKADRIRDLYESLKQELKSRAGAEEEYYFTKSFREILSHGSWNPEQEEREEAERWALGSGDFYPDELNDRLVSIIEEVDEKNFGSRTVDRTFLEDMMEKKVTENQREHKDGKNAAPEKESWLER